MNTGVVIINTNTTDTSYYYYYYYYTTENSYALRPNLLSYGASVIVLHNRWYCRQWLEHLEVTTYIIHIHHMLISIRLHVRMFNLHVTYTTYVGIYCVDLQL